MLLNNEGVYWVVWFNCSPFSQSDALKTVFHIIEVDSAHRLTDQLSKYEQRLLIAVVYSSIRLSSNKSSSSRHQILIQMHVKERESNLSPTRRQKHYEKLITRHVL